jgi:hypothetical protein
MLRNLFGDTTTSKNHDQNRQLDGFNLRQFRDTLRKEIATQHERRPVYQANANGATQIKSGLLDFSRYKSIDKERSGQQEVVGTRFQRQAPYVGMERSASKNDSFVSNGNIFIPNFVNIAKSNPRQDGLVQTLCSNDRRPNPEIRITDLGESIASSYSKYPDNLKTSGLFARETEDRRNLNKQSRYNSEQQTRYLAKTSIFDSNKPINLGADRRDRNGSPSRISVNLSNSIVRETTKQEEFNEKIRKVRERFNHKVEPPTRPEEGLGFKNLRLAQTTTELSVFGETKNVRPIQKSRLETKYTEGDLRELISTLESTSLESIRNLPDW